MTWVRMTNPGDVVVVRSQRRDVGSRYAGIPCVILGESKEYLGEEDTYEVDITSSQLLSLGWGEPYRRDPRGGLDFHVSNLLFGYRWEDDE